MNKNIIHTFSIMNDNPRTLSFFFLAGFFIWGHWAAFYALLPDIVPYQILGTTYGLTNTIHFVGSLIAPWATGG